MPEETTQLPVSPQEVQVQSPSFINKIKVHKFKILGGILGFLVFAGAVFGAYKVGQRQIQPGPQPAPTPALVATPTPLPSEAPAKEGDPTASWKTYTNTKYGYSIKYPSSLTVVAEQFEVEDPVSADGVSIQQEPEGYNKPLLKIYVFNPGETKYKTDSLQKLAEANFSDNVSNKETFIRTVESVHESIFRGEKSYQYAIESKGFFGAWTGFLGQQGIYRIIIFGHDGKFILIGYYDNQEFNLMLSTFKFLE